MGLRKISKEDEAYSPPLSPDLEERLPALSKEAYPFFESLVCSSAGAAITMYHF